MDSFTTPRNSGNFIHYKDDGNGLSDCSADWETFSFEVELNSRKNILEEHCTAYSQLLKQLCPDNSADEIITNEVQDIKKLNDQLLLRNEVIFSKCNALTEEQKNIKVNLHQLTEKNESLQKTIKNLQEEGITSRKAYNELKIALQKANEMYTTYFDINVSTKVLSDTTYEASLYFKEKDIPAIKFTVDRAKRKIIDFHPNEVLSTKEEEDIRKEFSELKNPDFLCALRDIVLKK